MLLQHAAAAVKACGGVMEFFDGVQDGTSRAKYAGPPEVWDDIVEEANDEQDRCSDMTVPECVECLQELYERGSAEEPNPARPFLCVDLMKPAYENFLKQKDEYIKAMCHAMEIIGGMHLGNEELYHLCNYLDVDGPSKWW